MIRLLTACLLLLSCLLARPATSQVAPLSREGGVRGGVYSLEAGDVIRGPLIGLDTAHYRATTNYVAGAKVLLSARAARIAQLERSEATLSLQLTTTEDELRRCRAEAKLDAADFRTVAVAGQKLAEKPPSRPLLLDGHFYKGVGTGGALAAVAAVLLKVFVFH